MVEFGGSGQDGAGSRPGWLRRSAGLREPRIGWALGVLGAAALFASLVGEWATTTLRFGEGDLEQAFVVGAGEAGNWGAVWMIGALAMTAVLGICLAGPAHQRGPARTAGLAMAGALLLLMVAATVEISSDGLAYDRLNIVTVDMETEVSLGRGLFAAFAALGLLAAALWLSVAPRAGADVPPGWPQPSPQPWQPQPGQGTDLTVQPAEPFIHPTGDHEWR